MVHFLIVLFVKSVSSTYYLFIAQEISKWKNCKNKAQDIVIEITEIVKKQEKREEFSDLSLFYCKKQKETVGRNGNRGIEIPIISKDFFRYYLM